MDSRICSWQLMKSMESFLYGAGCSHIFGNINAPKHNLNSKPPLLNCFVTLSSNTENPYCNNWHNYLFSYLWISSCTVYVFGGLQCVGQWPLLCLCRAFFQTYRAPVARWHSINLASHPFPCPTHNWVVVL
jgi:hypothetical protein